MSTNNFNCYTCNFFRYQSEGYCYMWKEKPKENCYEHSPRKGSERVFIDFSGITSTPSAEVSPRADQATNFLELVAEVVDVDSILGDVLSDVLGDL